MLDHFALIGLGHEYFAVYVVKDFAFEEISSSSYTCDVVWCTVVG